MTPTSKKRLVSSSLGLGALAAMTVSLVVAEPARALPVYDASNHAQNLVIAARTLDQINNQIRSLQNEAAMLANQARNLARIDFPQIREITTRLQQIDRLMQQAQGLGFRIADLDDQFQETFPGRDVAAGPAAGRVMGARARLETAMATFRHAMVVQAQVVENVEADVTLLSELIGRSQNAEGALQATQATNQLLALTAKQQFQLQQLLVAQHRAASMDAARRTQAEADGRAATTRFLGSGRADPPR